MPKVWKYLCISHLVHRAQGTTKISVLLVLHMAHILQQKHEDIEQCQCNIEEEVLVDLLLIVMLSLKFTSYAA